MVQWSKNIQNNKFIGNIVSNDTTELQSAKSRLGNNIGQLRQFPKQQECKNNRDGKESSRLKEN